MSFIKSTSADKRLISTHDHQLRFTNNHASLCPLLPLYLFSSDSRPKYDKRTNEHCCLCLLAKVICFLIVQTFASGQLIVGGSYGWASSDKLSSVEIFPPPNDTCSVPSLPGPRSHHSLSLLSGGRLVVCGGRNSAHFDSCISWVAGNTSWTPIFDMR